MVPCRRRFAFFFFPPYLSTFSLGKEEAKKAKFQREKKNSAFCDVLYLIWWISNERLMVGHLIKKKKMTALFSPRYRMRVVNHVVKKNQCLCVAPNTPFGMISFSPFFAAAIFFAFFF